jgi:hypothetical protein
MQAVETYEWVFTNAQTNLLLLNESGGSLVGASQRMAITYVELVCANSNVVDVAARIGFAATTLPTITDNSPNGQRGVFTSHPAIAKGGGKVNANGGATLALGDVGIAPRITITVSTGGATRLIMSFMLLDAEVVS